MPSVDDMTNQDNTQRSSDYTLRDLMLFEDDIDEDSPRIILSALTLKRLYTASTGLPRNGNLFSSYTS